MALAEHRQLTEATGIKILRALEALNGKTQRSAATAADALRMLTDDVGDGIADELAAYLEYLPYQKVSVNGPNHNGIFRGKYLGTITSSNIADFVAAHRIAEGLFDDLYLGDYFTIYDGTYNVDWMIAAFDLDYNTKYIGDNESYLSDKHAIFLIPRSTGLFQCRVHSTNDCTGGEHRSEIWDTEYVAAAVLKNALGGYMYNMLIKVTNCNPTTRAKNIWVDKHPIRLITMFDICGIGSGKTYSGEGISIRQASSGRGMLPIFRFINSAQYNNDMIFWVGSMTTYDNVEYWEVSKWGSAYEGILPTDTAWLRPIIAICGIPETSGTPTRGGAKGGAKETGEEIYEFGFNPGSGGNTK